MDNFPDDVSAFECAACGLVIADPDGLIRRVNTTFCQWLDYAPDELVGQKKVQHLFTVGGRFFHHTHWAPLLQMQGSVAEVQMDILGQNGQPIPMLVNAVRRRVGEKRFDYLAFFIATDRKKYERELLSTRQRMEESISSLRIVQRKLEENQDILGVAIQSARLGVWSRNLQANTIWWNQELESLTGWNEAHIAGNTDDIHQFIHQDDRAKTIARISRAIRAHSNYVVEFRIKHADGHWLTFEGRGHASYDDKGKALTIFGILMDISERRATELRLRELNEKLSLADRRKDEFLATLAHELRNPLAPMRNVLEIMRLNAADGPLMNWSRDIIDRHVQQMSHLVDDLLEASRFTQGKLELRKSCIALTDVLYQAVESTSALTQEFNHELLIELPAEPIEIYADATRLIQIVSNLLTNAVKYTPAGGKIFLRAWHVGDEAIVSIRDTGIGIPKDQLSNVFNMFSQLSPALERSQGGLGIGLALVRGLVELHGGKIMVMSEGVGKGSEFIVHLPVGEIRNATNPLIPEQSTASISSPRRILVVDDNIDAAESLSMLLSMQGHAVETANNGLTGFQCAGNFLPDIIILDIGLPDINGYEVARKIRSTHWGKHITLIAATGWSQEKDKALAHDAGFNFHVTKPIDFQQLNRFFCE